MTSSPAGGASPLTLRNGFRCAPEANTSIEDVLLAVGAKVGNDNISSASRMNKAVVVFLKSENQVKTLIESGIWINETYVPITPLSAPATKIVISNVPPFVGNEIIIKELTRFGKIAGAIKEIPLGCKNAALKHVLSFRRHVYMFLSSPTKTLDVSFRIPHGESSYMVYASTETLRCFECGDIGHKRFTCPHKARNDEERGQTETPDAPQIVMESTPQQSGTADTNTEVRPIVLENIVIDAVVPGCSGGGGKSDVCVGVVGQVQENETHEGQSEEMDDSSEATVESCRDDESLADVDVVNCGSDLYSVEQINAFLDETKGKSVEIGKFFPDGDKFVVSVMKARQECSLEVLSQQKRFRLKKYITTIRQGGVKPGRAVKRRAAKGKQK